jgi:squalene cyclase
MVLLVSPREEDSLTSRSMISYPNYKFIFPIKALGMFARRFGDADAKA